MILNDVELELITLGLLKGKGLILPKFKNASEYDDMIKQVENYIDNLVFTPSKNMEIAQFFEDVKDIIYK